MGIRICQELAAYYLNWTAPAISRELSPLICKYAALLLIYYSRVIAANQVGNGIVVLNLKPFDHRHEETVFSRQELGLSFCEAIW